MIDTLVLVGRIVKKINNAEGNKTTSIILAVPRSYKNAEGIYETDFIKVTLAKALQERVKEWTVEGDLVGVMGRIESNKKNQIKIIVTKMSFLKAEERKEN